MEKVEGPRFGGGIRIHYNNKLKKGKLYLVMYGYLNNPNSFLKDFLKKIPKDTTLIGFKSV